MLKVNRVNDKAKIRFAEMVAAESATRPVCTPAEMTELWEWVELLANETIAERDARHAKNRAEDENNEK